MSKWHELSDRVTKIKQYVPLGETSLRHKDRRISTVSGTEKTTRSGE